MATFVTSDAHGHLRALDRVLELAAPGSRDTLYVLGDMVDRGPDPVGVIDLVRSLPNARVLMGNHEAMMLSALASDRADDVFSWELNGGSKTARALDALPTDRMRDLLDWVADLPLSACVRVPDLRWRKAYPNDPSSADAERIYLLAHAGIHGLSARGYLATAGYAPTEGHGAAHVPPSILEDMMGAQDAGDLLWIRGTFWSEPTGLVGLDGRGPVVIAGHTPSVLLRGYARLMSGSGVDGDLRGVMVEVGATRDTGGEPDRIDIDCSAAAGYPNGRVGIMRLEDRRVWYADIGEGE